MRLFIFAAFVAFSVTGVCGWLWGRFGLAAFSFLVGGMLAAAVVYPLWGYGSFGRLVMVAVIVAYIAATTWAGIRWVLRL